MDDPGLAWPAWKFGMKRDAIHTTLHEQYNTFQSTIQDPDAFHHDVHEIASEAGSAAEFHRLLSQRREQRLNELNDSLESASYEIIANPMLVGTQQWEHALQLFRSRSLDSLVRYFASYLPSDHQWYQPKQHDAGHHDLPPSPRSVTTYSDDMETSAHDIYSLKSLNTVSSYTDSESGQASEDEHQHDHEHDHEHENVNAKAADIKTTVDADVVHDDSKHTSITTLYDDDCSSQSSGPDTPESMSDAEPDVDVTDNDDAHLDHHAHHITEVAMTPKRSPETPSPATVEATKAVEAKDPQPTPKSRRSPLQSGFAADATPYSPMPSPLPSFLPVSSAHARQRSMSPSRPYPLVCVAHADDHIAIIGSRSDDMNHSSQRGRAAARPSRAMRGPRLNDVQRLTTRNNCNSRSRSHSPARNSRRRPGVGVEKTPTPLPRPMRTRLRVRREAAAAAVQRA